MGRGGRNTANANIPKYTLKDVAQHNTKEDAWLVYRNKVYDFSNWGAHPGGQIIFTHAGRDATDVFNSFHPGTAHSILSRFYIGNLVERDVGKSMTPFAKDMEGIRKRVRRMGWHKASPLYYTFKIMSNILLWAIGAAFCMYNGGSYAMILAGCFFIGLFWQQNGWLAHDFCHHQVFDNRLFGDIAGLIIGNLWQGFSVEWWKDKHNTHHAIPNMHETADGAHDGDPDIDTMPLLAWSQTMATKAADAGPVGRFFIKHQSFLYFPILLVARLSWLLQSFTFVFRFKSPWNQDFQQEQPLQLGIWEHLGLIGYYFWYLGLVFWMTPGQAIVYLLASQMMCGLMLALSFGLGHNGMATYDADKTPEFYEWQITTTRNVDGSFLVGWFMGGLHLQIEHHLFPYVPRHNLHKIRTLIEPLCAKHGIPYKATSMWEGTVDVLNHLREVTTELLQEFPGL